MKPRRGRGLWVLLAAIGVSLGYLWYEAGYIRNEVGHARLLSLGQSSSGIDTLERAGANAATVAIDGEMFRLIAEKLRGQSVSFTMPEFPNDVLTASLRQFELTLRNGAIAAKLALTLTSDKRPIWLDADVDGAVLFSGIKETKPATEKKSPVYAAQFRIMPEVVALSLKSRLANLPLGIFSDMAAANAIRFFSQQMTIPIPFEPKIGVAIAGEYKHEQKFGDDGTGLAKIEFTHPDIDVHRWIHVASPIFTERGVILAATVSPDEAKPFELPEATGATVDVAGAERQINAKLPGLLTRFSGQHLTIDLSAATINDITTSLANVARGLAVGVRLTQITGKLFNKEWSFPILGRQNAYGEIPGGGRSLGSINIPAVELGYAAGSGLSGSIDLNAAGQSPVYIKVNSFARLHTTVEIHGAGKASLKARVASSVFAFEGSEVTLVGPVLECTALVVTAKTNGKFQLGESWASVPSLGATFGFLVGKSPLEPLVAVRPMVVPVLTSRDKADRLREVTFPKGLYVNLAPKKVGFDPGEGRYRISLDLKIEPTNAAPEAKLVKEGDKRLDDAAKAHWNEAMKPACPELPAPRVQVGELEIGPNGEIITFLRNLLRDLTGAGDENEAVKITRMLEDARQQLDDAARQVVDRLLVEVPRHFPNSEALRGLAARMAARAPSRPTIGDMTGLPGPPDILRRRWPRWP